PLVLDRPDTPHRVLGSTAMVTLGRWSYGLFVWHLAALAMVFPVLGTFPFTGRMPTVLALTLIFGWAIAAVSYGLVESPCREELRRGKRPRPPDDDPFYQPPPRYEESAPGSVLRSRTVELGFLGVLPQSFTAIQLLYRTTNLHGDPEVAVTTVLVPEQRDPQ